MLYSILKWEADIKAISLTAKGTEKANFTIKMVVAMMVSGGITKWKDLESFTTKMIAKHIREHG